MRDDLDQQLDDFGTAMPAIAWASPTEIRKRGDRRRRVHTAGMTAAAVVALALAAGTAVTITQGRGAVPVPPGASGTPSAAASPSAEPSPLPSSPPPVQGSPSPSVDPPFASTDDAVTSIPVSAMLAPADLGPDYKVAAETVDGDWRYAFGLGMCQSKDLWDGKPGMAADAASRERSLSTTPGAPGGSSVVQGMWGHRTPDAARQTMDHWRDGFETCDAIPVGEGRTLSFSVVRQDFAGDESMLVKSVYQQPGTDESTLHAFVRVGAVYTEIAMPEGASTALALDIARKAVERICGATPAC